MKVQEVILRAIAKQITWWQAAEIIGISDRQLRRWQRVFKLKNWPAHRLYSWLILLLTVGLLLFLPLIPKLAAR